MRTTINLDDALLAEAKQVAARTGRSLTAVVEDALRESLRRRQDTARGPSSCQCSVRGVQPGVDLDDGVALLDLMEQDDPGPTMRLVDVNVLVYAHRLDTPGIRTTPAGFVTSSSTRSRTGSPSWSSAASSGS